MMQTDPEQPFYTVEQLAERWQLSVRTVRRFIKAGELSVHRIGTQIRIAASAVMQFEKLRRD